MSDSITFAGKSGTTYQYWFLADVSAKGIKAEAGNYVFLKLLANGKFQPLYFGEAEDLQDRINTHDRWDDALRVGMTHVAAHLTPSGEKVRCAEERDLIQEWQPVLNTQHRQTS